MNDEKLPWSEPRGPRGGRGPQKWISDRSERNWTIFAMALGIVYFLVGVSVVVPIVENSAGPFFNEISGGSIESPITLISPADGATVNGTTSSLCWNCSTDALYYVLMTSVADLGCFLRVMNTLLSGSSMDLVKKGRFDDIWLTNHSSGNAVTVGQIWDGIIEGIWKNGEPGVLFYDTINKHNPTPQLGDIDTTNPWREDMVRERARRRLDVLLHRSNEQGRCATGPRESHLIGHPFSTVFIIVVLP